VEISLITATLVFSDSLNIASSSLVPRPSPLAPRHQPRRTPISLPVADDRLGQAGATSPGGALQARCGAHPGHPILRHGLHRGTAPPHPRARRDPHLHGPGGLPRILIHESQRDRLREATAPLGRGGCPGARAQLLPGRARRPVPS
jgi:hypothetical protein